jgi:hypothetical protein
VCKDSFALMCNKVFKNGRKVGKIEINIVKNQKSGNKL